MFHHIALRGALLLSIISSALMAQHPQAEWENLPGPDGGHVLELELDGDLLYALTTGGIFRSQNNGETWGLLEGTRIVSNFRTRMEVESDVLFVLQPNGKLLRSRDLGATWKAVQPVTNPELKLFDLFAFGDTLLTISPLAIYFSFDQGDTWQEAQAQSDFFAQNFKSFARVGGDIFMAYDRYILKSTDGGQSWEKRFTAGFDFADMAAVDTVLYALYDGYPRLIRSYDRGEHWSNIQADSILFGPYYWEAGDWITGTGDKVFFASDYGCIHGGVYLFHSFNAGDDWSQAGRLGLRDPALSELFSMPQQLLAGTAQGLFRSEDDGASFHPYHRGMNSTRVHTLMKLPGGRLWVNAIQGVFSSDDNGYNWILRFPGQLEDHCGWWRRNSLTRTAGRLFYKDCRHDCPVWMSEDGGDTWTARPNSIHWPAVYGSGDVSWWLNGSSLYKLKDTEDTLSPVALPAQGSLYNFRVAGDRLALNTGNELLLSADGGDTWQNLTDQTPGSPMIGEPFYLDDQALFAQNVPWYDTTFMYDFKSETWAPYAAVVDGDTLKASEYRLLSTFKGIRWMAVYGRGLYYASVAEPKIWYPFAPALPYHTASAIVFDPEAQEMLVGTFGAGIFRTRFEVPDEVAPRPEFIVYPNPSVGTSTLASTAFFSGRTLLRVFDLSGKQLHEQSLPPGQSWEINLQVPGGLYIWQIITPQGTVLVKWVKGR